MSRSASAPLLLLVVFVLLAAGCGSSAAGTAGEPLLVAAAADLRPAFTLLGEAFEEATGEPVTFVFGSSGQLAQQLVEGAPMDVYASANVAFVEQVVAAGVGDPATQATYAHGRITLWSAPGRGGDWRSLADLAADPEVRTIALANPEHAPYGQAGREAFEAAGVWEAVEERLVYGENVADTQRIAATGNADAAVVALSLALAADEDGGGSWVLLDEALHAPLRQALVVTATDADRARRAAAFVDFVGSPEGRTVMRRYGFLLPGEDPPQAWER